KAAEDRQPDRRAARYLETERRGSLRHDGRQEDAGWPCRYLSRRPARADLLRSAERLRCAVGNGLRAFRPQLHVSAAAEYAARDLARGWTPHGVLRPAQ